MNPESKTETLFGGRMVAVTLLDGTTAEFKVRQLPLGEYEAAFKVRKKEMEFTALVCGHDLAWLNNVAPESYEVLRTAAREVNAKGFFSYATRQETLEGEQLGERIALDALRELTAEKVKAQIAAALPK